MNPHLLTSDSTPYITALIGNGEIVTTVGPTGYHTGGPWHPALEISVWSGRRMHERIPGFIRMGCFRRSLKIAGTEAPLARWEQAVSPEEGLVRSRVFHEGLTEETTSFVRLDRNILVLTTDLTNKGSQEKEIEFQFQYRFGDNEGYVPTGSVVRTRNEHFGPSIYYEVADSVGTVEIRPLVPMETIQQEKGWLFIGKWTLSPGEKRRLGFQIGHSDRRKYCPVLPTWNSDTVLSEHKEAWRKFQGNSTVNLGLPEVEALRRMCLYSIRCNATPWSIPPAVLPTHWEGRTFHDELYPFLALLSGGHRDLAERIVRFRLNTLPKALEYSGFRGARYPWETTEKGEEGGPCGDYMDEHFHMGQFVESAFQFCTFEDDPETWREYFPLFRECAEYFALNLVEEHGGQYRIRPCTDYDEAISPVSNGIYTSCAAIRCLEIASNLAERFQCNARRKKVWDRMAAGLRQTLPKAPDGSRYIPYDGVSHHHIAEIGPVFPFRVDPNSEISRRSVAAFSEGCRADVGWTAGSLPGYRGSRWMWSGAHLATCYALLGDGEKAVETLIETVKTAGPALTPCEQTHPHSPEVNCPWFTTAAGGYVYAVHTLFLQAKPSGIALFPAWPASRGDCSFSGLAAPGGVRISAEIQKGTLRHLEVKAPEAAIVSLLLPSRILGGTIPISSIKSEPMGNGEWIRAEIPAVTD